MKIVVRCVTKEVNTGVIFGPLYAEKYRGTRGIILQQAPYGEHCFVPLNLVHYQIYLAENPGDIF